MLSAAVVISTSWVKTMHDAKWGGGGGPSLIHRQWRPRSAWAFAVWYGLSCLPAELKQVTRGSCKPPAGNRTYCLLLYLPWVLEHLNSLPYLSQNLNKLIYYRLMWIKTVGRVANSVDPDQMSYSVVSDLGLHCLLMSVIIIIIIGFLINMQVQGQHSHQWAPFQIAGLRHAWQISHQISTYFYCEGW